MAMAIATESTLKYLAKQRATPGSIRGHNHHWSSKMQPDFDHDMNGRGSGNRNVLDWSDDASDLSLLSSHSRSSRNSHSTLSRHDNRVERREDRNGIPNTPKEKKDDWLTRHPDASKGLSKFATVAGEVGLGLAGLAGAHAILKDEPRPQTTINRSGGGGMSGGSMSPAPSSAGAAGGGEEDLATGADTGTSSSTTDGISPAGDDISSQSLEESNAGNNPDLKTPQQQTSAVVRSVLGMPLDSPIVALSPIECAFIANNQPSVLMEKISQNELSAYEQMAVLLDQFEWTGSKIVDEHLYTVDLTPQLTYDRRHKGLYPNYEFVNPYPIRMLVVIDTTELTVGALSLHEVSSCLSGWGSISVRSDRRGADRLGSSWRN
jgi:hypothetical protein